MTTQTWLTLLPVLKGAGVVVGIVLAIFLCAFVAELIEQADIGREIDDERGGE